MKKSLSELTAKWAAQCIANPNEIITTSGDYLVLYDLKRHKVVAFENIKNLELKGGNEA